MNKFCNFYVLSSLLLAATTFSCRTAEQTYVSGPGFTQVLEAETTLDKKIEIANVRRRVTNSLLEVEVDLRNKTSQDLSLEYTFEFFDEQGFQLPSSTEHWTPVTLNGRHVLVVNGIAPRAGAETFKIHVRYPHEVQ